MKKPESPLPVPEVLLPPEMRSILEGLGQTVLITRQQTEIATTRFRQYVLQCAVALGVNDPKYKFDPQRVAFVENLGGPHPKG